MQHWSWEKFNFKVDDDADIPALNGADAAADQNKNNENNKFIDGPMITDGVNSRFWWILEVFFSSPIACCAVAHVLPWRSMSMLCSPYTSIRGSKVSRTGLMREVSTDVEHGIRPMRHGL